MLLDIAFVGVAIFWIVIGQYAIAGLLLLLSCFGFYTNRDLIAVFTEEMISYPSFIPKTYTWSEVSNVILKDDVLTIDLKNNNLHQNTLTKEVAATVNESDFNAFCMACLSKHLY